MSARPGVLLCVLLCAPWSMQAIAADLKSIIVEYEDGVYTVDSEVWFDADQRAVYAVFADWDLAVRFSSAIVESRNTAPDADGNPGYFVRNEGCILFFCKSFVRNGTVRSQPISLLQASADPAHSDFELSDERWSFRSEDGGTIVNYSLKMKPAFWVPPLIGPYLIKRKLRNDSGDALNRIEQIAKDWKPASG
ncbi:MAG TPA: SRPBCC family protein [Woeseiaceae bacterium]|nr:SRPBCC family protein [Woeseiaceae bacterium]